MEIVVEKYLGDGTEWDSFVDTCAEATNYHRYGWKRVVEKSFGHNAHYLTARNSEGCIIGILPLFHMQSLFFGNFLVSVPFFNYGGLLCSDPKAASSLVLEAQRIKDEIKASHIELRHVDWEHKGIPSKIGKVTMVMELAQDVDSQWKAFNAKLRNQIRKAEKSGLQVVFGGMELLNGFYEVFCRNMRDLGTPVYGKEFFRNVLAQFPQSTRIISVIHNGTVIASGIVSWFRGTVEVPWASSNRDYKVLCPNNILYWKAISFAIEKGFEKFDFGRSTPGEGTFKFKEQWGAKPIQLYWQYLLCDGDVLPELNNKNPKYELAINIWQKLPLSVTKFLGPHIVKNIP